MFFLESPSSSVTMIAAQISTVAVAGPPARPGFGPLGSSHTPIGRTHLRKSLDFAGDGLEKLRAVAKVKKNYSLVVAMANQGFDFNSGGGRGGGGGDKNETVRIIGNLVLAIGLTYLTMTGQLGWVLDAVVSIWLLAFLLPILGLAAFFWFAGQDIVQDSCPNCGNEFQIFKSSLKDGVQFCPYCAQPITVEGNKFVMESARFSSNRSAKFREAFKSNSSPRSTKKEKPSSGVIVDIEAEVMDAE